MDGRERNGWKLALRATVVTFAVAACQGVTPPLPTEPSPPASGDPLPVCPPPSTPYPEVSPSCGDPAPLRGIFYGFAVNPDFNVKVRHEFDVEATAALLAERHGFEVDRVYVDLRLFNTGPLTPEQVARLQCEPAVRWLEHEAIVCFV